jgi:hypothetical protein
MGANRRISSLREVSTTFLGLRHTFTSLHRDAGTLPMISQVAVRHADVAQLVEHRTRNAGVRGSSPLVGSIVYLREPSGSRFVLGTRSEWCTPFPFTGSPDAAYSRGNDSAEPDLDSGVASEP